MKKIYIILSVLCFLSSGCKKNGFLSSIVDEELSSTEDSSLSAIIVRAASNEKQSSTTGNGTLGQIVFTGNDMLWFNETTKELRFKDNWANSPANNPVLSNTRTIFFYIGDEFLFSSMVCVNSSDSENFDSLVLYYNAAENKYYLLDGYPPESELKKDMNRPTATIPDLREENRNKIAAEWTKFVNQLKKDGKYTN